VWPRGDLTAQRGLPGLLPPGDDQLDGVVLDPSPDDLISQLTPLLAVKKQACDATDLAQEPWVRICTGVSMSGMCQ
jgi:hypothetical protein